MCLFNRISVIVSLCFVRPAKVTLVSQVSYFGARFWFEKCTPKLDTINAKIGHHSNSIHTYIHIYAVELKAGPRFGVSSVKNWSKSSVKNWSKFFFAVFSPVL